MSRKADFDAGYGGLLHVRGFGFLFAGLLLGRIGGSMMLVTLVLFALSRYNLPQLAGATAFVAVVPGLVVSPLAGALLDRYGRARLVILDYLVGAAAIWLIAELAALHSLVPATLLIIVALASFTNPLSATGARTLFPLLTPPELWIRANALDSGAYVLATLIAPPLAGVLVESAGPELALAATGAVFVLAAMMMTRLPDAPFVGRDRRSITRNAWLGLKYTLSNASLRGLALSCSIFGASSGLLTIALPVLVIHRFQQGPAVVGLLWGAMGAAGIVSALVAGRYARAGIERQLMLVAILISATAMAILPIARSLGAVALAVVILGLGGGPFDIALFTLRQRRTDPAWFGRAFAVSMSLNSLGTPIGSAIAGPLIHDSLNLALWTAAGVALASATLPMFSIPSKEPASLAADAR
jgi:MFS family permease